MLGIAPRIGRSFAPEEEQFGKHRVAILSDRLWRQRFGGDPNTVGTQILLGGFAHTVVGVMPPMPFFDDLPPMDVFLPISLPPGDNMDSRNNHYVTLVGRLLPGVTPRDARADADAIARQIEEQLPQKVGFGAQVVSVTEQLTEDVEAGPAHSVRGGSPWSTLPSPAATTSAPPVSPFAAAEPSPRPTAPRLSRWPW